jgi:sec-independent protein translocase protein TatC
MIRDIDDAQLTLTEHLTELRSRLLKSGAAVLVTSALCMALAPTILEVATEPLRKVLREKSRVETLVVLPPAAKADALLESVRGFERVHFRGSESDLAAVAEQIRTAASGRRPIDLVLVDADAIGRDGSYLSDLLDGVSPPPFVVYLVKDADDPAVKQLQLDGAVVLLQPVREPVLHRVVRRAAGAAGKNTNPDRLVVLSPLEVFFAYLKIAIVCGIFLACPIWLYQAWAFVAPGLYATEKKVVLPVVLSASALFVAGGAFAYAVMFPVMFDFLVNQMLPDSLAASFTVDNYIGLLMRLTVAFGVVFELPLALALLSSVGLVTPAWLAKQRKYAIVVAFVLGAFLTPADPLSQSMMAVPLVVFYEAGIWLSYLVARRADHQPASKEST